MVTISNKQRILIIVVFTLVFIAGSLFWYFERKDSEAIVIVSNEVGVDQQQQDLQPSDDQAVGGAPVFIEQIYIHVKGAVQNPGVYQLDKGKRVVDAVNAAGGSLPEGNLDLINLAALLQDGQEVIVYTSQEDQQQWQLTMDNVSGGGSSGNSGKININTATSEQLQTLTGIGPSKAEAIIKHREKHGLFATPESLLDVNGIGQKTLENLLDDITVQ